MRILDADSVEIEPGDMVCLHTGFADTLLAMNRQPDLEALHQTGSGLDGWESKLLNWIVDVKLACLLADNPAVELVVPKLTTPTPMRRPRLPLHEHCLFKNGIHLGELWYLTELAALAASPRTHPLPADRSTAAIARCGRVPCDTDRNGLADTSNDHGDKHGNLNQSHSGHPRRSRHLHGACRVAGQARQARRSVRAGGAADALARVVASELGTRLKQQVIVENKAGAGGTIGAQAVAQSPARRLHVPL